MGTYSKRLKSDKARQELRILKRIVVSLSFILFLAMILSIYISQDKEMARLTKERDRLTSSLSHAKLEQRDIRQMKSFAGTKEFVERMARDELGLIKPDEIIFSEQP